MDKRRHIYKAFTWRIIASLTTFFTGWGLTNDITMGLKFGAIDVVLKLVLYYLHERAWFRWVFLGRKKKVRKKAN